MRLDKINYYIRNYFKHLAINSSHYNQKSIYTALLHSHLYNLNLTLLKKIFFNYFLLFNKIPIS